MSTPPTNDQLFAVRGHLAERYADALKHACGQECPLPEFKIDRLGWSPQLAAILGDDYMNCEAIRYGIILSPDQADAPLIKRRFSYEITLTNRIYDEAHATILNLIENEPVIVEFDNGLSFCRTITDVLAIRTVQATLSTPRDTLSKTAKLWDLAKGLHQESRLLDDTYIEKMLVLAKEVGDPYRRPMPPTFQISDGSFWAETATPVYVLRDGHAQHPAPLVITIRPDTVPSDLPFKVLDLGPELVDPLHDAGYLRYIASESVLRKRIANIERDILLSVDIDPSDDAQTRRRQLARSPKAQELLPPVYWELDGELKRVAAGAPFKPDRISYEARWAMSAPARANEVMVHLLARFVRYDYRLFVYHHQRLVEAEWSRYSEAKRRHLAALFPYLTQVFAIHHTVKDGAAPAAH
jgi:hypothetical protein